MDKKVNPQELIQRIADRIEGSKTDAERFVQALFEIVEENLLADKVVRVKGIGTFKMLEVNARTSVDVNTKERIEIKEHFRVTFTPDAVLKDKVNKPFSGFTSVVLDECNVDTGVLENTEEDPLTDEQLTAYETVDATTAAPPLNIHVDIPTEAPTETPSRCNRSPKIPRAWTRNRPPIPSSLPKPPKPNPRKYHPYHR
jgi:nucleoid DNA-binding protein